MDIHFSRMLLVRLTLRFFWWFYRYRIGRGVPLHVLFCGREYLDPAREVIPALVPDEIVETGPDPVRLVEKDLIPDFEHKEAPCLSGHIHPPDHALGKALPWTGWMEVDANLIPNGNLRCLHLRHSRDALPRRRQALRGPHGGLGAIGRADLAQDGFDVDLDGGFGDHELAGNELVGLSLCQASQDFPPPAPKACKPSDQIDSALL